MFKSFFNDMAEKAKRFAPAALTPEKRFAKGIIAASALMTMADGKADEQEVDATSSVIAGHRSIKQFLSPTEAHDIYRLQIAQLQEAQSKGGVELAMVVNNMIAEIADGVKDRNWRTEILDTAKLIGQASGGQQLADSERTMLNKIQASLV